MRRAILLLGACGGGSAAPDGGPRDAPAACTATWSGNFAETATAEPCATIAGTTLTVEVPSTTLGSAMPATIELGAAAAGTYSSSTVASWSASATRQVVNNTCIYQAGSTFTPPGVFTLTLSDTTPHGMLVVDQAVLAAAFSICGDPLTEHLEVTF